MRNSAKLKAGRVLPPFCEFRAMCLAEQNLVLYDAIEKLVEMQSDMRKMASAVLHKPVLMRDDEYEVLSEDGWPK